MINSKAAATTSRRRQVGRLAALPPAPASACPWWRAGPRPGRGAQSVEEVVPATGRLPGASMGRLPGVAFLMASRLRRGGRQQQKDEERHRGCAPAEPGRRHCCCCYLYLCFFSLEERRRRYTICLYIYSVNSLGA